MPDINITVAHKVAVSDTQSIVCDNSDYMVHWTLDEDWSAYDTKTMRTIYMDGTYEDTVFNGDVIALPVCTVPGAVQIGLFAGNLRTSRVAILRALQSVRSGAGAPSDPTPDVYDQLMELIKGLGVVDPDDISKAVADYLAAHPIEETDPTVPEWAKAETKPTYSAAEVGAISQSDLQAATDAALAQAKSSGEFDGADGKSAYQYAQEGGFTGTEAEFAEKLAQEQLTGTTNDLTPTQVYQAVSVGIPVKVKYIDSTYGLISFTAFNVSESLNVIASHIIAYFNGLYILCELYGDKSSNAWGFNITTLAQKIDIPSVLPNPNALTFTGSVTGSYDGSAPMTVKIPSAVTDDHIKYLPLTGGKLTGNLEGKYITGTWLQSTAAGHQEAAATKVAVLDAQGWIYYRTPAELMADMGLADGTEVSY